MSDTIHDQIAELHRQWVRAEIAGDTAALDELATDDFTLVGPVGFVLTRAQWLGRYTSGAFTTTALELSEVAVRDYGTTAVIVAVHTQQAAHQGNPANGSFRTTHVAVLTGDRWRLAGMHLSPIGGPPPFARPDQG